MTQGQAQHILDGLLSLKNPNLPQSIRSATIDECHAFVAGAFQVLGLTKRGER